MAELILVTVDDVKVAIVEKIDLTTGEAETPEAED